MKTIGMVILSLLFLMSNSFCNEIIFFLNDTLIEYRDISKSLSTQEFEIVKSFILINGNRETYSNMYGNNPHYSFNGFDAYLNPEIGQGNINCDPNLSDFNEIVIRDQNANPQYYFIHIVRNGDLEDSLIISLAGMNEEIVYLINYYDENLDLMESSLNFYIGEIKKEISIKTNIMFKQDNDFIFLFPNPVNEQLYINNQSTTERELKLEIIDKMGKVINLQTIDIENITNPISIGISQLPQGLYIGRLQSGRKVRIFKFFKN